MRSEIHLSSLLGVQPQRLLLSIPSGDLQVAILLRLYRLRIQLSRPLELEEPVYRFQNRETISRARTCANHPGLCQEGDHQPHLLPKDRSKQFQFQQKRSSTLRG
eukprot:TCALIF_08984-PA protein Name:"Protein of unknown function" AED:0.06 eAED:0.06 QI:494/0.66/0.5/0.75/0.66/0.5/4/142/104